MKKLEAEIKQFQSVVEIGLGKESYFYGYCLFFQSMICSYYHLKEEAKRLLVKARMIAL